MKALYDKEHITRLIPQREPMVQVDEFFGIGEDGIATAGLTVREENIFCEEGHLSLEGLTEHMAQSAAARAGYEAVQRGEEVRLGFIGAVRGLSVVRLPRCGERLTTSVEVVEQVMGIALISLVCRVGDEEIASCSMKIFTEE